MTIDEILTQILAKRGLASQEEISSFFNPRLPEEISSPFDSKPAIQLIKQHIQDNNKIAIYGDYDVDGVCSTAILWETLYRETDKVFPHIPHREAEGYGLSNKGIDHCLQQGAKLIIAVDNGIVAHEQINYCRASGCDIIVIDHHQPSETLPTPNVLLHSTSSCAAGLTWLFCRDYLKTENRVPNIEQLSLVALASVCDLVPLLDLNRSFVKYGLQQINKTTRTGLLSLFEIAGLKLGELTPYHLGFVIGPRLNAMGRLEHAIDSLRLLCTRDLKRSRELAQLLQDTNLQRQTETQLSVSHAVSQIDGENIPSFLIAADASYHSGIIGLVAAKLVENFWRPSVAISIGETLSKGSGRSITGFHITDFLRQHQELFVSLGGHGMACGFTIETAKLPQLVEILAKAQIDKSLFERKQRVDLEISLEDVSLDLVKRLEELQPFGLGNPTPQFKSAGKIEESKWLGRELKHLKLQINGQEAIWFNASKKQEFKPNSDVQIIYSLEKNIWNNQERVQLVIKDLYV